MPQKHRDRTQAYIKGLRTQIMGLKGNDVEKQCLINDLYRRINRLTAEKAKIKQEVMGEAIVPQWTPIKDEISAASFQLAEFRPGDVIAIIGRVSRVESEIAPKCNNKVSRVYYTRVQTRRLSGFLPA